MPSVHAVGGTDRVIRSDIARHFVGRHATPHRSTVCAGIANPTSGDQRTDNLLDLVLLQRQHRVCRLPAVESPPREIGTM